MTRTDGALRPRRQLSLRLLGYILLISSAVTLLLTAWQLWSDYTHDVDSIEERFHILERTTLDPLTNSVWALNEDQIRLLMAGMMNLDAVVAVDLETDQGRNYHYGEQHPGDAGIVRRYPLTYRNPRQPDQSYALGTLTVHASLEGVYDRLFDRAANILVGQALKTFIVSIFILMIVQRLVTRHLGTIADYARHLSVATLDRPLALDRPHRPDEEPDELDRVETAINYMRETLAEDIARREATESRLQQSEARYRQLFESSTDGLGIFDLDGRLLTANRAYLELIGHTLEQARQLTYQQITPARWHAAEAAIVRDQIMARGYSDVYEKEYIHRDGHTFPVSIRGWLVRDEHNEPQFLMGFARDISRQKQLEAEREKLEQQLRESQRLETVGTLAGGIAHDFNNLLTPIKGYAEMLVRDAPDEQARTRAEAIFHAAERGRKLVDKILLFSRRGATHRAECDLAQIARETLELVSITRPPTIRLAVDVQAADTRLHADPTQLHQVVMNLAVNAFHAMDKGGELRVVIGEETRTPPAGGAAVPGLTLRVSDTGGGIAPENLGKIFEPFFTTRDKGRGTGLGLSVVHGIVKGHGGEIGVESSPAGSTFTVWLPRGEH